MARKKSEFLKAAGKMWSIMQTITNAVLELGGDDEDLHRLLTDSKLAKQVAELIMFGRQKASDTFKVVVNYGKTLAEMIQFGKYGWVNDDITDKHFPIQGAGTQEAELVLVHLNRDATTKEVLAHLDSNGLKAAGIEHLLAFGATYPEIQKEFPVIALGSAWVNDNGNRNYPYLNFNDDKRKLNLNWNDDDNHWNDNCRFLAVCKSFYSLRNWRVYFFKEFSQPPIMLPISARGFIKTIYLLLSKALISQINFRKNFKVSNFTLNFCTIGNFVSLAE